MPEAREAPDGDRRAITDADLAGQLAISGEMKTPRVFTRFTCHAWIGAHSAGQLVQEVLRADELRVLPRDQPALQDERRQASVDEDSRRARGGVAHVSMLRQPDHHGSSADLQGDPSSSTPPSSAPNQALLQVWPTTRHLWPPLRYHARGEEVLARLGIGERGSEDLMRPGGG